MLTAITDYTGAAFGFLILEDALEPVNSVINKTIDDAEWVRSYLDTYLLLHPMRLATFGYVEPGTVVLTSDLMTH